MQSFYFVHDFLGKKLGRDSVGQFVSDLVSGNWGSWGWRIHFHNDFAMVVFYLNLFINPYRQHEVSKLKTNKQTNRLIICSHSGPSTSSPYLDPLPGDTVRVACNLVYMRLCQRRTLKCLTIGACRNSWHSLLLPPFCRDRN